MTDFLITSSFIAGLIPAVILFVMYGGRTRWNHTFTGRGLFYLLLVTVISYGLSVLVLLWPDVFRQEWAEWVRITVRFMIAIVLWNFLRVFLKAQNEVSVHPPEKVDD